MHILTFLSLPVLLSALCHSRLDLLRTGDSFTNLSVISQFQCRNDRILACVYSDGAHLIPTQSFMVRNRQLRAVRVTDLAILNDTLQESEDLGANGTLLMLPNDGDMVSWTSALVIGISEHEGERLESVLMRLDGWTEAWLSLTPSMDCGRYQPLMYVWTVVSIGWILFLALWLCWNYYWHPHQLHAAHKALTILLACKVMQVYFAYSRLSACSFTNAPGALLKMLEGVCGTLFESAYYALLMLMSAGLFVLREELPRWTATYLVGITSLLYLGISVQNMLETESRLMSLGVLGFVWVHCSLFGLWSYLSLRQQFRLPNPFLSRKFRFFLLFLSFEQLFFLLEASFHLLSRGYISDITADPYKQQVWWVSLHETVEAVGAAATFLVFSATAYSFFSQSARIRHPLPLYRSSEGLSSGIPVQTTAVTPVLVLNPGKVAVITLGYLMEAPERVEARSGREVELSLLE